MAVVVGATGLPAQAQTPGAPSDTPLTEFQDVPLLASEPPPAPEPAGLPVGELSNLPRAEGAPPEATPPDPSAPTSAPPARVEEIVAERSADSQTYGLDNGMEEVVLHEEPKFFQPPGQTAFQPIDARVVADPARTGSLRSKANRWAARFDPMGPQGGLTIETPGGSAGVALRGARAGVRPALVAGTADPGTSDTVRYDDVLAGVDLDYTVSATGIREDLVLAGRSAPARYTFDLRGATARSGPGCEALCVEGRAGKITLSPLRVVAADGLDVTLAAGARLAAVAGLDGRAGGAVDVVVNSTWLSGAPDSVFPLTIDPDYNLTSSNRNGFASGGQTSGAVVKIGRDSAGVEWRSVLDFPTESYQSQTDRLIRATLALTPTAGSTAPEDTTALAHEATQFSYTGAVGDGAVYARHPTGDGITVFLQVPELVGPWMEPGAVHGLIGVSAPGPNGSARTYTAALSLFMLPPPPLSTLTAPLASTLSDATPTLTASAVAKPASWEPNDQVVYNFEITSNSAFSAGAVVNSGWILPSASGPSWTVPPGELQDGLTYWARVSTTSLTWSTKYSDGQYNVLFPLRPESRQYKLDLGLGSSGASPKDVVGVVPGVVDAPSEGAPSPATPGSAISADLVSGNVSVQIPLPTMATVSGGAGVSLAYNSQVRTPLGLTGRYYHDANRNRVADAGELANQRVDPRLQFYWGSGSAIAGVPADRMLAKWNGTIKFPTTGTWKLGVVASDGARVYVDDDPVPVADAWSGRDRERVLGPGRSYTLNQPRALRVEMHNGSEEASVRLIAERVISSSSSQYFDEIPATWFATDATALPTGWQLSADGAQASYAAVRTTTDAIIAVGVDGSSTEFRKRSEGGYTAPPGSEGLLTVAGNGRIVLHSGGYLYEFNAEGELAALRTAVDDRRPAALQYEYSGSPLRLRRITDPVSARAIDLIYGGATPACITQKVPSGMLCRVDLWDGSVSRLTYNDNRQLVRVENPGYDDGRLGAGTDPLGDRPTQFDFAYGPGGLLSEIRDPLANDLIAYANATDGPDLKTLVHYSSVQGEGVSRVSIIESPAPELGAFRPQKNYAYDRATRTTTVKVAGLTTTTGWAHKVSYDEDHRIVEEIDGTGALKTTTQWDGSDRVTASTDPAGLRTTYHYDHANRPTETFGPAPVASFDANNRPLANPAVAVPRSEVRYDEGLQGLAATWWANPDWAGSPVRHTTEFGTGSLSRTWAAPPYGADANGDWSLRLSGEISVPYNEIMTWQIRTLGRARVYLDDEQLLPESSDSGGTTWAEPTSTRRGYAGKHRLRVDYAETTGGAGLELQWAAGDPFGFPLDYITVPSTAIAPRYGLATTSIDPDGKTTKTEYSDSTNGIGLSLGLPTATVVDPEGLALRSSVTYENPTTATTFLRRTRRTLAGGDSSSYTYYGGTEVPLADACGVYALTPQGGALKRRTGPDPDAAGPKVPKVEEFLYDARGRAVGRRVGAADGIASAGWSCTRFDGRGRIGSQSWPAHGGAPERIVYYSYANGDGPLRNSVTENGHTVTTVVDRLGRPCEYQTSNVDRVTVTSYDRAGRVVGTNGAGGDRTYTYEATSGRLATVNGEGPKALAKVAYDAGTGRVANVEYANTSLVVMDYDAWGRPDGVTSFGPNWSRLAGDEVTRSLAGRVTDQRLDTGGAGLVDPRAGADNFTYDGAGRLTEAWDSNGRVTYGFGESYCPAPLAGRNANPVSVTRAPRCPRRATTTPTAWRGPTPWPRPPSPTTTTAT